MQLETELVNSSLLNFVQKLHPFVRKRDFFEVNILFIGISNLKSMVISQSAILK